jgi:hypothetical protein
MADRLEVEGSERIDITGRRSGTHAGFLPNFFSSLARVFGSLALRIILSRIFRPFGESANAAIFLPSLPMSLLAQH